MKSVTPPQMNLWHGPQLMTFNNTFAQGVHGGRFCESVNPDIWSQSTTKQDEDDEQCIGWMQFCHRLTQDSVTK